jgi:putative flippase GtrA
MFKSIFKSAFIYGLMVSVPATIADWSIYGFGIYILELHYALAAAMGVLCGTTVNALLSRKIAFNSKGRSKKNEMTLLYIAGAVSYFLNLGFLALFIEIANISPMIAKIITTFIVFVANYGFRQFFVFDSKPKWGND